VITHGVDGLLVPPRDVKMLAHGLVSLLNDEALRRRMGSSGRRKVEGLRWEGIAQRTLDYYQELLEAR
jgi:phosphatidylinositol alpha 1,6-mannosyltransferase